MIFNSIWDACSVVILPNLAIQSLEFDQNSMQTWQNNFSYLPLWLYDLDLPLISGCVPLRNSPNGGKVQNDFFFQYWFMNLIFIFQNEGEGSYWRGGLDGMNMVFHILRTSFSSPLPIIVTPLPWQMLFKVYLTSNYWHAVSET